MATGEDAVKFVVDRRPSKTLLADMNLWNVSETGASETTHRTTVDDDDDVEIDDKQHKQGKKRQHSDAGDNQSLEMLTSVVVDSSDRGTEPDVRSGKKKQRKKREPKEHAIGRQDWTDSATPMSPELKKHRSSNDTNDKGTDVEPDSDHEAVILMSESPESFDSPRHVRKNHGKNRKESSVNITERGTEAHHYLNSDRPENMESEDSTKPVTPRSVDISPSAGRKTHRKKRAKNSVDDDFSSTVEKADGVEESVTRKSSETTAMCGSMESPRTGTKETVDVQKSSGVEVQVLFQWSDDSNDRATKAAPDSDVTGSMSYRILSTPPRGESDRIVGSPRSDLVPQPADTTVTDSQKKKGHSPQSCLYPSVILESPVKTKSPTKTTRCPRDAEMSSPVEGLLAGQATSTAIHMLVRYV